MGHTRALKLEQALTLFPQGKDTFITVIVYHVMKPGGNRVQMGYLGQPHILVPLGMIEGRTEIRRSIAESASLMLLFLSLNKVTHSSKQILAVSKQYNTEVSCTVVPPSCATPYHAIFAIIYFELAPKNFVLSYFFHFSSSYAKQKHASSI